MAYFDECFDNGEPSPKCRIEGEHKDVEYRIYEMGLYREERWYGYDYGVFMHLPDEIMKNFESLTLPSPPGAPHVNFGPTDDDWIGWSTLAEASYNYTDEMEPLPLDCRDGAGLESEEVTVYTPEILHSAVISWISRAF